MVTAGRGPQPRLSRSAPYGTYARTASHRAPASGSPRLSAIRINSSLSHPASIIRRCSVCDSDLRPGARRSSLASCGINRGIITSGVTRQRSKSSKARGSSIAAVAKRLQVAAQPHATQGKATYCRRSSAAATLPQAGHAASAGTAARHAHFIWFSNGIAERWVHCTHKWRGWSRAAYPSAAAAGAVAFAVCAGDADGWTDTSCGAWATFHRSRIAGRCSGADNVFC